MTRIALGVVLATVALNAFAGGWYGLAGARNVPREWLAGSPFDSYTVPSVILLVIVGGTQLVAAIGTFSRASWSSRAAALAGIVLFGWIAVQVAIIGFVSWLQPAMALAAAAEIALATMVRSFCVLK